MGAVALSRRVALLGLLLAAALGCTDRGIVGDGAALRCAASCGTGEQCDQSVGQCVPCAAGSSCAGAGSQPGDGGKSGDDGSDNGQTGTGHGNSGSSGGGPGTGGDDGMVDAAADTEAEVPGADECFIDGALCPLCTNEETCGELSCIEGVCRECKDDEDCDDPEHCQLGLCVELDGGEFGD